VVRPPLTITFFRALPSTFKCNSPASNSAEVTPTAFSVFMRYEKRNLAQFLPFDEEKSGWRP
jgi:hypothetical protein